MPSAPTLLELLLQRADRHGDKAAFLFCPEGDEEHDRLTCNFMHKLETVRQTWNPAPDNPVFHRPVGSVSAST